MNSSFLTVNDNRITNEFDTWFYNEEAYYRAIIGSGGNIELKETDIRIDSERELEIMLLSLGNTIIPIINSSDEVKNKSYTDLINDLKGKKVSELFKWDYRNPKEAHQILNRIKMPEYIKEKLSKSMQPIDKKYVHKLNSKNVLISYPERFGNVLYFRGFKQTEELKSDHLSDHLDGIKLFEVVRQSTLAAFHVMGVQIGKIMVLTSTRLDFTKLIELDKPYFIQLLPVCKIDGGAMFTAFNVIQEGVSHANGYIEAYTFRTKEAYQSKRFG